MAVPETDMQGGLTPGGTPRIVVAEDDPHVRRILVILLERRWRVEVARDGEEAWQLAVRNPPELILSDVMMPNVDGISLLRRLRADPRTQNIPVILLSARAGEDETVSGFEAGADDYLAKPFSTRELLARVQTRLEITAMRERNAQQAEALAALQRQQVWTRTVFDSLPVPALLLEPGSGAVRLANRAAVRLFGAPLEAGASLDAAGSMLLLAGNGHRADEGQSFSAARLAPTSPKEELHGFPLLWRTSAGSFRVLADSVMLTDGNGRADVTLLTLRDITPLVEREDALRRALRARDEFLSVASHELRTPLTTLGLHVDGLLHSIDAAGGQAALDSGAERRLRGIHRQMVRVDDILERLLDASRLAEGRVELQPEPVDVVDVAREAIEALRPAAEDAGSRLQLSAPSAVIGEWDRRRILQVLTTLLSNAVKFGQGKPVELRVEDEDARVRITVTDEGMGIAPEQQPHVFERFARVLSERHFPGLGLGLWSARRILEAFGGTVTVISELGAGARFVIELPRQPLASALTSPPV